MFDKALARRSPTHSLRMSLIEELKTVSPRQGDSLTQVKQKEKMFEALKETTKELKTQIPKGIDKLFNTTNERFRMRRAQLHNDFKLNELLRKDSEKVSPTDTLKALRKVDEAIRMEESYGQEEA